MPSFLLSCFVLLHTVQTSVAADIGPQCKAYLTKKEFASVDSLADAMHSYKEFPMPCNENAGLQQKYHPNSAPGPAGGSDTSQMGCRYGNPSMKGDSVCCGMKPHFNWIVSTCEHKPGQGEGQFCKTVPDCAKAHGSPAINYVAAYQYNGSHFVLMEDSTVGEITEAGVSGSFSAGNGWEAHKEDFTWKGGDWTTKYAPWAREDGPSGPRGVTPPAGLWILSADNFYYGAFYMLSQLGLNLDGHDNPTKTNCWMWELDPVEGSVGWSPGKATPGNLNQLYSTDNAQASGCMPLAFYASQMQGFQHNFSSPEMFKDYCTANPTATGCQPWASGQDMSWSGGSHGTQRFENYWNEPYVFAIVVDGQGYWTYRWRPDATTGETGWPGISRNTAQRVLPKRPNPVKDPNGLKTNVRGDVREAVILQPGLSSEASCLRASIEAEDWQFGSAALAAMADQLGENKAGGKYAGAQNWWTNFVDTEQYQKYPLSIAGVPFEQLPTKYSCNTKDHFSCQCKVSTAEDKGGEEIVV